MICGNFRKLSRGFLGRGSRPRLGLPEGVWHGCRSEAFCGGIEGLFPELTRPASAGTLRSLLIDILAIAILAVMSGAEDWPDIEEFGRRRATWLKGFLQLPHGIPSHDTFRRVFGLLDRKQFAACLFQWTQALHEATGGKVIAIDGKTARRSFNRKSGLKALHLVTAWASESGLTLGQIACEEKSNEITAIPELLKLLNLKGCTVTIDAMGCQKEIAAQIREQKGHYVLGLKGNQSGLEADMRQLMDEAKDSDFQRNEQRRLTRLARRGMVGEEERTCEVIEIPADHPQRSVWKDLCTLVIMTCCRMIAESKRGRHDSTSAVTAPKPRH